VEQTRFDALVDGGLGQGDRGGRGQTRFPEVAAGVEVSGNVEGNEVAGAFRGDGLVGNKDVVEDALVGLEKQSHFAVGSGFAVETMEGEDSAGGEGSKSGFRVVLGRALAPAFQTYGDSADPGIGRGGPAIADLDADAADRLLEAVVHLGVD
jgi:hypothetical protein